jgi:hypothetical protein
MRTVTHAQAVFAKSRTIITLSRDTNEVVTGFTSSDCIQNACHVHMSPAEARRYAQQLIIAADKLEPLE